MATKKPNVDEVYDANAEASPRKGVVKKGTAPAKTDGKLTVTHKRKGLGLHILDKAQLFWIAGTYGTGMFWLYDMVPEGWRAHAMWVFTGAAIVAALPNLLRKRE